MQDHDRGNYRDARRRQAKEAAEAIKNGKADEMFFGASPTERKGLRKTKDKRAVDVDKLNLDGLDRDKFQAPDKVGENLRLIDMAMGNEPAPPKQPGLHPAAPKKEAQPRPKKKAKRRPKSSARNLMDSVSARMPSWLRKKQAAPERDDFKPAPTTGDEGVVVAKPKGRGLEVFAWVAGLGALAAGVVGASPDYVLPASAAAFPDGLQALLTSRHGLLGVGLACLWLAVVLRIVRRPRGGIGGELLRASFVAALPGALAGGLVHAAGRAPSLGLTPDGLLPALAPLEPHLGGLGIPLSAGVGAVAFLVVLVPALFARMRAPIL